MMRAIDGFRRAIEGGVFDGLTDVFAKKSSCAALRSSSPLMAVPIDQALAIARQVEATNG